MLSELVLLHKSGVFSKLEKLVGPWIFISLFFK